MGCVLNWIFLPKAGAAKPAGRRREGWIWVCTGGMGLKFLLHPRAASDSQCAGGTCWECVEGSRMGGRSRVTAWLGTARMGQAQKLLHIQTQPLRGAGSPHPPSLCPTGGSTGRSHGSRRRGCCTPPRRGCSWCGRAPTTPGTTRCASAARARWSTTASSTPPASSASTRRCTSRTSCSWWR